MMRTAMHASDQEPNSRHLGGDLGIVAEVIATRGLQQELAIGAPDDPRRLFGESVEAAGSPTSTQLTKLCADALMGAMPGILNKLDQHIDNRLANMETRKVNLNVRAPKRPASQDPPITHDISGLGRPYPIARFLDEKQRQLPALAEMRRNFAPSFGMIVQVLKKKKLKEDGRVATWVEQNHRAQLLYTIEDKDLMQSAWEMTAAHREDLVSRSAAVAVPPPVPRVLAMLQNVVDA